MFKFIVFFLLITQVQFVLAGHFYKLETLPTLQQAVNIGQRAQENTLELCCSFPGEDIKNIVKEGKFSLLILKLGYFLNGEQIKILDSMGINYELVFSDLLPTDEQVRILNESQLSSLKIEFLDFPSETEALSLNKLKKKIRIDIIRNALPSESHMRILRKLHLNIAVAFYNTKVPGPGHVWFFNSLKNKKIFVVLEKLPFGIDASGLNTFENIALEFRPTEKIMDQDIKILNDFNSPLTLTLTEIWPLDNEMINKLQQLNVSELILEDDGNMSLLDEGIEKKLHRENTKLILSFARI